MKQAVKHLGALVLSLALVLGLIASTGMTGTEVQAADTTALSVGSTISIEFDDDGEAWLTFTPEETGLYTITTTLTAPSDDESDVNYYIYDSDTNYITYGYAYASAGNTRSATKTMAFTAGETYTFLVEYWTYYGTPTSCTMEIEEAESTDITSSGTYSCSVTEDYDVWLVYTPSSDGLYEFTLTAETIDNYEDDASATVYRGSDWYDVEYAYVYYDSDADYSSDSVAFAMESGETYYIRLRFSRDSSETDSVALSVSISGKTVTDISSTGTYSISSTNLEEEYIYYYLSYTPTADGVYTFTETISAEDGGYAYGRVYIYDSSWNSLDYVYASTNSGTGTEDVVLSVGETYYLVYRLGYEASGVSSSLTITQTQTTDISSSGTYDMSDISDSSGNDESSKVWLTYTPSASGWYVMNLSGTCEIDDIDDYAYVCADANMFDEEYDWQGESYYYSTDSETFSDNDYVYLTAGETYYIDLYECVCYASISGLTLTISQDITDISSTGTYSYTTSNYDSASALVSYTASASGTYTVTVTMTDDTSSGDWCWTEADVYSSEGKYLDEAYIYYSSGYTVSIEMTLTQGETYYILLYGNSEYSTTHTLTITAGEDVDVECTHEYTGEVTTKATCTEEGVMTYTCSLCGDTYTETIAATGHSYDEGVVTKEATCSEEGVITYTCSVCGETKTETIEKTAHIYDEGEVTDPTCTLDGYTTYTCTVCGESYTGDVVVATGHTFGEWTVVSSPTCTEAGSQQRTCTVCGYTETADIDATGHTPADDYEIDVEATCTTDGSKSIKCTVCGATIESVVIPATGHTWDEGTVTTEPTCTEEGVTTYTCTVCGETYTEAIAALGHTWDEGTVTTEPTCTEKGVTTYTCTVCGETYTEAIAALGHTYDSGTVTTAPTCEEEGVMTYTCTVCDEDTEGHTYTEAIAATGHDWDYDNGVVTKEATADEEGVMTYTCKNDSSHTLAVSIACLNDVAELQDAAEDAADDLATLQADDTYSSEAYAQALENYAQALEYAGEVLADQYASTEEVEEALQALADAQTLVDAVQAAEDAVTAGADLSESDYTAESWAAYAKALSELQALLSSSDATAEELTAATAALTAAQAALVTAETSGSDSESDSDSDEGSSVDAVATSDAFPVGGCLALMLAACGALLLLMRRRAR